MKYKKKKLKLNEVASAMHGFYFLVKFCLVLIYILKVCFKRSSSILLRKKNSTHYLHFSFEKHVLSQFLKDFSVENLETTSSTSLSKFSCEIYLSRVINYWGIIFTLSWTWGEFSLVYVLSVFFSFFLLFFFLCCYFPWQILKIHRLAGKGERITR